MQYLEQQKVVHRDLALRNLLGSLLFILCIQFHCLIIACAGREDKYFVKVGDFGLSRVVQGNYYKSNDKAIPVKWSAPESLEYGTFTSKSDVW